MVADGRVTMGGCDGSRRPVMMGGDGEVVDKDSRRELGRVFFSTGGC